MAEGDVLYFGVLVKQGESMSIAASNEQPKALSFHIENRIH